MTLDEANARAWRLGRLLLHRAIERRLEFVFETTLGGRTMTGLLLKAANLGLPVHVFSAWTRPIAMSPASAPG